MTLSEKVNQKFKQLSWTIVIEFIANKFSGDIF